MRNYVADAAQQSATVDRFLDELDAMAPAAADVKYPLMAKMRSASRRALKECHGSVRHHSQGSRQSGAGKAFRRTGFGRQTAGRRNRRHPVSHPACRRRGAQGQLARAAALRQSRRPHAGAVEGGRFGAMVCQHGSDRRRRTRVAASVVGSRRTRGSRRRGRRPVVPVRPDPRGAATAQRPVGRVRGAGGRPSRVAAQGAEERDRQEQPDHERIAGPDDRAVERPVGRRPP